MCIPCVDPVASSGCSVAIGRRALVLPPRCQRTRVTRVQATSSPSDVDVTKENHGGDRDTHRMRRAVLTATKEAAVPIVERERPLREYMALPASQYSVLDARKIERIDDATFKVGLLGPSIDAVSEACAFFFRRDTTNRDGMHRVFAFLARSPAPPRCPVRSFGSLARSATLGSSNFSASTSSP